MAASDKAMLLAKEEEIALLKKQLEEMNGFERPAERNARSEVSESRSVHRVSTDKLNSLDHSNSPKKSKNWNPAAFGSTPNSPNSTAKSSQAAPSPTPWLVCAAA